MFYHILGQKEKAFFFGKETMLPILTTANIVLKEVMARATTQEVKGYLNWKGQG